MHSIILNYTAKQFLFHLQDFWNAVTVNDRKPLKYE